ncbi:MAG: AMP-binding protein [Spirochaetales bacterium]|nr:AMP-binding protein [Spirochaetales bacterium]
MIKKFNFIPEGDAVAYHVGDKKYSFNDVRSNIGYYSAGLGDLSGEIVWLFGENSIEWIFTFYSVWNMGGICVPVDTSLDEAELDHILRDSKPNRVFCSDKTFEKIDAATERVGVFPTITKFAEIDANPLLSIPLRGEFDFDATALIVYTSGTTGKAKGVMLSFESVVFNLMGVVNTQMMVKGDRYIVMFPFHHTVPLQGHILCPLFIGAEGVFLQEISPAGILEIFNKYKITLLNGVPRLYNLFHKSISDKINSNFVARVLFFIAKMVKSQRFSRILFKKVHNHFGGSIKVFLSGGAPLDRRVVKDFYALGIPLVEGYGMTEMGPLIAYNTLDDCTAGTVGKPVPGVEVKIENNEILARSPGIMKGYYNRPEETSKVIIDGWCHTGDKGYLDKHGNLVVSGRIKDLIVLSSGKNIDPEEIETTIFNISDLVKELAVIEKNDALYGVVVPNLANFEFKDINSISEKIKWEVFDKYNKTVPSYKRVFDFTVIDRELPRTTLGKIRRFMVADLVLKRGANKKSNMSLDDPETREIVGFLSGLTDLAIAADSHLQLDLGLDSISILEFKVFLHKKFGIHVDNSLASYRISDLVKDIKLEKFPTEDLQASDDNSNNVVLLKNSSLWFRVLQYCINSVFLGLYVRSRRIGSIDKLKVQNFIIACNHQSFLDPFLLAKSLPRKILKKSFFIAKTQHFKSKIGRFVLKNINAIITDKELSTEDILKESENVLMSGNNLIIFPEGTRSYDGNLLPFKKSFAILSKELNIPILPVAIQGSNNVLPRTNSFPKPGKVSVRFLDPIFPEGLDLDAIINITEDSIRGGVSLD